MNKLPREPIRCDEITRAATNRDETKRHLGIMWTLSITILVTAALTSCSTLLLALFWFRTRVRRQLDVAFEEKLQEVEERLGELIEQRVSEGVVKGVAAIPSREVLRDTTRNVARTGAELVEEGLDSLLRGVRGKR